MLLLGSIVSESDAQWFDDYKSLGQIYSRLDQNLVDHGTIMSGEVIGQSWEGRDIRAVKLRGTGGTKSVRPAVVLNGTVHAREWISPMTNMYGLEQLADGYGSDPMITSLLDEVDVYVLPVMNPDGYEYSRTTDRFWRKNRRPVGGGQVGVDLNRNFSFGYGLDSGSSSSPWSDVYRGPSAFSEPETQAYRDFFLDHQNIVSHIDFHAYSQLILQPWGYRVGAPPDAEVLNRIAVEMSNTIEGVHGKFYNPIPANLLYLASGISTDWTYGDQGAYAFTVELRPDSFQPGFELPAGEIIPTAEENFEAILDLISFTSTLASGDFDYDGDYDCADVEALGEAIVNGSNKAEFDVNGDGVTDANDLGAWLASAGSNTLSSGGSFLPGDANLDGSVDGSDFNVWNENKFTQSHDFCSGDFNADGFVDGSDFNIWNQRKFTSSDSPTVVPEPSGISLIFAGLGIVIAGVRRRKRI